MCSPSGSVCVALGVQVVGPLGCGGSMHATLGMALLGHVGVYRSCPGHKCAGRA